jgi:hypothetical protein
MLFAYKFVRFNRQLFSDLQAVRGKCFYAYKGCVLLIVAILMTLSTMAVRRSSPLELLSNYNQFEDCYFHSLFSQSSNPEKLSLLYDIEAVLGKQFYMTRKR